MFGLFNNGPVGSGMDFEESVPGTGLLGGFDPRQMGLLSAAASMLNASGPSATPRSLGQVMGQGLMGGLQGFGMGQQMQVRGAQMAELQRKAERQKQIDAYGQSLPENERPLFMADPGAYIRSKTEKKGPLIVPAGASVFDPQSGLPMFTGATKPEQDDDFTRALKGAGIEPGSDAWKSLMKARADRMVAPPQPLVQISTGDKKVDEKFAGDFVEFATGGYADVQKQIGQLEDVAKELSKGQGLTGPMVGAMPRHMMAVMNPKALAAMESVEEVGQRNLRLVLGAQYTEKEGERLISRVYNPMLSEAENLKRVNRLAQQMKSAAEAKLEAAKYFQEHGTLKGWKGKLWTIKDFNVDKDDGPSTSGGPKKGDLVDGWEFMGGDPANKNNWRKK